MYFLWIDPCLFKAGLSPCKKVGFISFIKNPLKMMNSAFYFILKEDVYNFSSLFKGKFQNLWCHKLKQTITINILPDISKSKENQAMKFCQLIEYKGRYIFFKNHAENEAGRLVSEHVLFFK